MSMALRSTPGYDQALVDIADYVVDYKVHDPQALATAHLCLVDALACAMHALDFRECTKLLGPIVPGIVVAHGARVPGTSYELDPASAAFSLGCLMRWLDYNDAFVAAQGGHPSDNIAGILTLADYLSRRRCAEGIRPLTIADVYEAMIKAYEIQGCISLENDFNAVGVDQTVLVHVASAAVLT